MELIPTLFSLNLFLKSYGTGGTGLWNILQQTNLWDMYSMYLYTWRSEDTLKRAQIPPYCEHTMGSQGCLHYSMNKGVYQTHVDITCHTKMINIEYINYQTSCNKPTCGTCIQCIFTPGDQRILWREPRYPHTVSTQWGHRDVCITAWTSNGSWCIGIKGEMSGTVCVTFTWDIYIYMSCL